MGRDEVVTGLLAKGAHVLYYAPIGSDDRKRLSGVHGVERGAGSEDGQWAIQSLSVKGLIRCIHPFHACLQF